MLTIFVGGVGRIQLVLGGEKRKEVQEVFCIEGLVESRHRNQENNNGLDISCREKNRY